MNLEQVPNAGDHIALPQELIECAAGFSAVNDNPVKKLNFWYFISLKSKHHLPSQTSQVNVFKEVHD